MSLFRFINMYTSESRRPTAEQGAEKNATPQCRAENECLGRRLHHNVDNVYSVK